MSRRWCIIASPRSGSNLLEEILSNSNLKYGTLAEPAIRLGEYLHYEWYAYSDSNAKKFAGKDDFSSQTRINFRKDIEDIIKHTSSPITMRIFLQKWHQEHLDLNQFFLFLKENNFSFVYLSRNLIDRVISLSVAQETHVWHRRIISEKTNLSIDGGEPLHISTDNKIKINLENLAKNYFEVKMNDFYNNDLKKSFAGLEISYENLLEDCQSAEIPVPKNIQIQKLYSNTNYSDLIENYQEVINFIKWFQHE